MPRLQPTPAPIATPRLDVQPQLTSPLQNVLPSVVETGIPGNSTQLSALPKGQAMPTVSLNNEPLFFTYTVKRGDNLSEIAERYLGSQKKSDDIFNANRNVLRNPHDINVGMKLQIPMPAGATLPVEQPEAIAEAPAGPAPADYQDVKVKRGESLSVLALRHLGDSDRYMEIFNANRDQLKSPDSPLSIGMNLKVPPRSESRPNGAVSPTRPPARPDEAAPAAPTGQVDNSSLTPGAQEILGALQRYQQYYAERGNKSRTTTTPAEMREIAIELDQASKAMNVDPKLMLAVFAHESGGFKPRARSHTGAGGLGQLTGVAIRQVHHMAGIGRGTAPRAPFSQHRGEFVQSSRNINQRYNIAANVWTSTAYMRYELQDRDHLGAGVKNALKRYGDPTVSTYADKVNAEYKIMFGGKLF